MIKDGLVDIDDISVLKEAEDSFKCKKVLYKWETDKHSYIDGFKDGATFGYNKANEWYRVSDKLPEMDVLVYLWKKGDDFPVVARRHIFYGQKEWVWDCMWGSGYTMSQSKGKDYLWKEITLPNEVKEND